MSQTKTKQPKPAAAEAPQPEPSKPRELRSDEAKRQLYAFKEFIREFGEISPSNFEDLKTFKLILDRDRGANTPIEDFITGLVQRYGTLEEEGEGPTMHDVEHFFKQLVDNDLEDEIRHAHFMASRYPLPEPEAHTASE